MTSKSSQNIAFSKTQSLITQDLSQLQEQSILIIAAEASSVPYALQVMREMKKSKPELIFFGVGSSEMEQEGFIRFGESEKMAVMGIAEVLKHYSDIKKVYQRICEEFIKRKPQVVLLLDYPGFNLRLAEDLKEKYAHHFFKIFYYIAPQVWAWKKNRIYKIKKYCDESFLLFPFEKTFYDSYQVKNQFVGHPLLDEVSMNYLDLKQNSLLRQKFGLRDETPVLGLMPGSRLSELEYNFKTQLEVAQQLSLEIPNLRIMILAAPSLKKETVLSYCEDVKFDYTYLQDDPQKMIAMTDVVLAASGTATLLVGLLEKPMVVMYKMNWLTYFIAKLIVKGVKYFCIVNLIFDREVVPERLQGAASVSELTSQLKKIIMNPDVYSQMVQDLKKIKNHLGDRGAYKRVAQVLLAEFNK